MDTGEHIFIVDDTDARTLPTLEEWPRVLELALSLIVAAGGEIVLDELDEPTEKRQVVCGGGK